MWETFLENLTILLGALILGCHFKDQSSTSSTDVRSRLQNEGSFLDDITGVSTKKFWSKQRILWDVSSYRVLGNISSLIMASQSVAEMTASVIL